MPSLPGLARACVGLRGWQRAAAPRRAATCGAGRWPARRTISHPGTGAGGMRLSRERAGHRALCPKVRGASAGTRRARSAGTRSRSQPAARRTRRSSHAVSWRRLSRPSPDRRGTGNWVIGEPARPLRVARTRIPLTPAGQVSASRRRGCSRRSTFPDPAA